MKKHLTVLLALVVLLSLTACGGDSGGAVEDATEPAAAEPSGIEEGNAEATLSPDEQELYKAAMGGDGAATDYEVIDGALYKKGEPVDTAVATLNLYNHQLGDYSFLSDFTRLETLVLDCTDISDLSPLANLTGLETLALTECPNITSLEPLSGCASLQMLWISSADITDITPLSGLSELTSLDLGTLTEDADMSVLAGLPNLAELGLYTDGAVDLSFLSELGQLTALNLSLTESVDLSALSALTKLKWFILSIPEAPDLTALANMTELQTLYIYCQDETRILNFAPLEKLDALVMLNLVGSVDDYTPISAFTELEFLLVTSDSPLDISILANITQLSSLSLYIEQTENLSLLAAYGMSKLEWLLCYATVEELELLNEAFPNCEVLSLE